MNSANKVSKRELMIETWERLDCESVGAPELAQIQRTVSDRFGPGAVESPAAIARLLADEGAVLRHPEVLECDALWRECRWRDAPFPESASFEELKQAAAAICELEQLRQDLEAEAGTSELMRLRESVQRIRKERLLVARSRVVPPRQLQEAAEVAEWLRVWLSSPALFADWLELRRRSSQFCEQFGDPWV